VEFDEKADPRRLSRCGLALGASSCRNAGVYVGFTPGGETWGVTIGWMTGGVATGGTVGNEISGAGVVGSNGDGATSRLTCTPLVPMINIGIMQPTWLLKSLCIFSDVAHSRRCRGNCNSKEWPILKDAMRIVKGDMTQ